VKILVDMNLSPAWVNALERRGYSAVHWSTIGDVKSSDSAILEWACANGYILFTNDLDFGAILASARATAPSVIQMRAQDLTPEHLIELVVDTLRQHETLLKQGALISVDEAGQRSRVLPLL
jgi:predicted nuclease of predicted toxin-antitoxin system